jgi:hypothetical protein
MPQQVLFGHDPAEPAMIGNERVPKSHLFENLQHNLYRQRGRERYGRLINPRPEIDVICAMIGWDDGKRRQILRRVNFDVIQRLERVHCSNTLRLWRRGKFDNALDPFTVPRYKQARGVGSILLVLAQLI